VRILDWLDDGEKIYFAAFDTNGLYCLRKSDGNVELMCLFPDQTLYERYRAICKLGSKLYLAPLYAGDIAIYDLERHTRRLAPIRADNADNIDSFRRPPDNPANFINAHIMGNCIFFTPLSFGAIVRYNTDTGDVDYFNDYVDELDSLSFDKNSFWFGGSCVAGDSIYLPSICANAIVEFDMNLCVSIIHKIGTDHNSYSNICHDGTNFWILHSLGDAVTIWNKDDGIVKVLDFESVSKYAHIFNVDGTILRVPCKGDLICDFIDTKQGYARTRKILQPPRDAESGLDRLLPDNNAVLGAKANAGKLYIYSTKSDSLLTYDDDGKIIEEKLLELSADDYSKIVDDDRKRGARLAGMSNACVYLTEGWASIRLENYIDYVSHSQGRMFTASGVPDGDSGKRILDCIRKEMLL
jgi:hypothetical protein